MVPSTFLGQIVGAVSCCVVGVILGALPIPVIQEQDIFKKQTLSVYKVDHLQAKIKQIRESGGRSRANRSNNNNNNLFNHVIV